MRNLGRNFYLMKLIFLVLILASLALQTRAQKITVSEEGKRVVCIIDHSVTEEGLQGITSELAKHQVTLIIESTKFNKAGNLIGISFKVSNAIGEASYIAEHMPKAGVQITSDLTPGGKNTIGVSSVEKVKD